MSDLEKEKFYEEFNREQGNPNNVKMFNLAKRSPKYWNKWYFTDWRCIDR